MLRVGSRIARSLLGRRRSRLARNGTPSAAAATPPSCRRAGPPRRRALRGSSRSRPPGGPGESSPDELLVFVGELRKRRPGRGGPGVDHEVAAPLSEELAVSAKDLPQPASDAVANHGSPDAPRDGQAESRPRGRQQENLEVASRNAHPGGVALFEFPSFSKAVVAGEGLPTAIRTRAHTESFLRPLRRRAEMTARPERVRMRTRNPWVRLRRRLLGWYVRFIKNAPC
jgi:hypothetical protein